jgi:hypothetical protein
MLMDVVTATTVTLTLIFMSNFKNIERDIFSLFPLRHEIVNY